MCKQKLVVKLILIIIVMVAIACSGSENKTSKAEIKQEPLVMEVSIGGMFCTGCEETIQKRVGELEGIKSVKASFTAGNAIIEFFPDKVDSVKIKEAITGSGYAVRKFIVP
jgi:copper chaperone